MAETPKLPAPETICAHWGEDPAQYRGAIVPPIYQNSLFAYPSCEAREGAWSVTVAQKALGEGEMRPDVADYPYYYDYSRVGNPTTDITEAKIAALERGEKARCFGSGMGAISAALLSCVRGGSHVIVPETVYGPTRYLLADYLPRFGVTATFIDGSDPQEYADALRPETSLLYLESPSSLVMKQQDLAAVAEIAKAHGATTIVDNSWASPYFQNPLEMGIDLVVHSATKYLGGHSDIVAGVAAGSKERVTRLALDEGCQIGAMLDPFAAWLLLRGLRTLPIRMERHQQTARRIAVALLEHPAVEDVFYPGLPNDPQPELTRRQLRGTGGLLSIALRNQTKEAAYRFTNALRWFAIGCSWGGFESLVNPLTVPPRVIGHSGSEPYWVIRLYLGLESADDLWEDLSHALAQV